MKTSLLNVMILMSLPRMGTLELEYATKEEIPAGYEDLYAERGGKFTFTAIDNLPDPASVTRLTESLRKERGDHKATREKFAPLKDRNLDELLQRDSEYDELKLRAAGVDDTKIEEMVTLRLKQKVAPIERERDDFRNKATTFETELTELRGQSVARKIGDNVRRAAAAAKVQDTALEDVELLASRLFEVDESGNVVTKDGVGVTPGITADVWLSDIKDKKPHWFPANFGGGGNGNGNPGGGGSNPWSEKNWNLTEQGKILKNDPEKAKRMASMHNVDPYNPVRPAKK